MDTTFKCMTLAEAAAALRVSRATVARMIADGAPHHRIRGRIVLTPSDLDRLLARTARGSSKPRS